MNHMKELYGKDSQTNKMNMIVSIYVVAILLQKVHQEVMFKKKYTIPFYHKYTYIVINDPYIIIGNFNGRIGK